MKFKFCIAIMFWLLLMDVVCTIILRQREFTQQSVRKKCNIKFCLNFILNSKLATSQLSEILSTLTLEYKKWSIEQDTLNDFVSAGKFQSMKEDLLLIK